MGSFLPFLRTRTGCYWSGMVQKLTIHRFGFDGRHSQVLANVNLEKKGLQKCNILWKGSSRRRYPPKLLIYHRSRKRSSRQNDWSHHRQQEKQALWQLVCQKELWKVPLQKGSFIERGSRERGGKDWNLQDVCQWVCGFVLQEAIDLPRWVSVCVALRNMAIKFIRWAKVLCLPFQKKLLCQAIVQRSNKQRAGLDMQILPAAFQEKKPGRWTFQTALLHDFCNRHDQQRPYLQHWEFEAFVRHGKFPLRCLDRFSVEGGWNLSHILFGWFYFFFHLPERRARGALRTRRRTSKINDYQNTLCSSSKARVDHDSGACPATRAASHKNWNCNRSKEENHSKDSFETSRMMESFFAIFVTSNLIVYNF